MAKDYNSQHRRALLLDIDNLLSPCEEVALQFKEVVITSNMKKVIEENIHIEPLKETIMKDTGWSESTFQGVDWDIYEKALMRKSRFERISIVKLIHGLYQTNERNNKFYHTTGLCPICTDKTEMLSHVLTCGEHTMVAYRSIIDALIYGLQEWSTQEERVDRRVQAPSAGSAKPADILVTQAFVEQWDTI